MLDYIEFKYSISKTNGQTTSQNSGRKSTKVDSNRIQQNEEEVVEKTEVYTVLKR